LGRSLSANVWRQPRARHGAFPHNPNQPMNDLIYLAVLALFFVAGQIYAHWCEKL